MKPWNQLAPAERALVVISVLACLTALVFTTLDPTYFEFSGAVYEGF
jgi:hypothetical protein